MLEHMKNYEKLLGKVASVRCHRAVPEVREQRTRLVARQWLKPDGKFFVHIFTHEEYAYHYEVTSDTDWMTKYFFAGLSPFAPCPAQPAGQCPPLPAR